MIRVKSVAMLAMVATLFLVGCASNKTEEPPVSLRDVETTNRVAVEVIEHKGSALGVTALPIWVETYILEGITGLEQLPAYKDFYCFVGEETGTNINAVTTWASLFDASSDIASTVSNRVSTLFTGSAAGSPTTEYGTYYEQIVRSAANATYSGARRVNDWWVLTRRYDGRTAKEYTQEYTAYVMYTIARDTLDRQILGILDGTSTAGLTTAQQTAISNVKELMRAEGFEGLPPAE